MCIRDSACTSHKIEARDLYNLVLKDIQEDVYKRQLWKRCAEEWRSNGKKTVKSRHRRNRKNRIWNFDRHLILKEIWCLLFWTGGTKIEFI